MRVVVSPASPAEKIEEVAHDALTARAREPQNVDVIMEFDEVRVKVVNGWDVEDVVENWRHERDAQKADAEHEWPCLPSDIRGGSFQTSAVALGEGLTEVVVSQTYIVDNPSRAQATQRVLDTILSGGK